MSRTAADAGWVATHPRATTAILSVAGYILVGASFLGVIPFPALGRDGVVLFSDLIAVINSVALLSLVAGYRFIKRGDRERHRRAMLLTFGLILLFLVLYVWKQSGGFTKDLIIQEGQFLAQFATTITYAYLAMLAIHVLLSVLAVPVVLHAVVLGLTTPLDELGDTLHPTVGRLAAASWGLSLALGVLTYWLLNHVYSWTPI